MEWTDGRWHVSGIKKSIEDMITQAVVSHEESHRFRTPIVGYASAKDPMYESLDEIIGAPQLHPREMLEGAKTVVVFFLPFSKEVTETIKGTNKIVKDWSRNYTLANEILADIGEQLKVTLEKQGIKVVTEPPTENFDEIDLTAKWSHKSSAVIAGIGTFGLNRLLITSKGTAGRLGSVIIDKELSPSSRPQSSHCLYYKNGRCKVCVDQCPVGALTEEGYDRFRCNAYLDGKNIHDLEQGCGMCSSGPCSSRGF